MLLRRRATFGCANRWCEHQIGHQYCLLRGRKKAIFICKKLGFNSKSKFGLLNEKALKNLSGFIDFYFIHGYTLKRLKRQRLDFLVKIKTYRGTRLVSGLLVRGQKSRNKKLRKYF